MGYIIIATCYRNSVIIVEGSDRPTIREIISYGIRDGVATDWYDLGVQLIPYRLQNQLDIISTNNPTNAKRCCREMFQYWLQVDTVPSWNKLVEALRCIKKNHLAEIIFKDVLQGTYIANVTCMYVHKCFFNRNQK